MRRYPAILIFLVIAFACDTTSNIRPPDQNYYVKYFGGDGNQYAVGLILNGDGTFFILGNSRQTAGALQKIYLAKADARGNLVWQTTYGGAEMEARDFVVANGGIVVVANRLPFFGSASSKVQLIQFTMKGTATDSALLQMSTTSTRVNSITVLDDGGFLISGNTNDVSDPDHTQDALHLRTDKNFTQRVNSWMNTYGSGTSNNEIKAFPYLDSLYFFGTSNAHYTTTTSDQNFWAFRLFNSTGGADGNSDNNMFVDSLREDILMNVQRATFGGYLLTGVSIDNNQDQSLKIIKLKDDILAFDSTDIHLKYSPRSLGRGNTPFATACNSISGFLVLANSYGIAGGSDLMLMKLYMDYGSQSLKELWNEPVIIGGDGDDTAAAVAELPDGHIIVLGTMNLGKPAEQYKITLMKLNSGGKLSD